MCAFGDLMQMLGVAEGAAQAPLPQGGSEGSCGTAANGNAMPSGNPGMSAQRQLLPNGIGVGAAGMNVIVGPIETADLSQGTGAGTVQETEVGPQSISVAPEQSAAVPEDAPADEQVVVSAEGVKTEQATSAESPEPGTIPVQTIPVEATSGKPDMVTAQPQQSCDPVEGAEPQAPSSGAPRIPATPVGAKDKAPSPRVGRTSSSSDDREIAAEESDESDDPDEVDEALALAPPPPLPEQMPVPKPQGDVTSPSEQHAQSQAPDRSGLQPELKDTMPAAGTAPGGEGRQDKDDDIAFSAKLVERDRQPVTPEATEARQVFRMAEPVAPMASHPTETAVPASGIPAVREQVAKPASLYQAPVMVEPVAPAERPAASGPARELRLSVAPENGTASRVEVRVSERAGEVRVNVQSPDPNVRAAVRSDLSGLVNRLEQAGYAAEITQPQAGRASDDTLVTDSRSRAETNSERSAAPAEVASGDSSSWDFNEGRRERREAPPRPFAPARPKAPGRRFVDEFIR